MKEKIDWYQEVLELEPGSKVFFPLAKLLAADGQIDYAVSTLKSGLGRHPEYIEARLYLVDLLHKNGMSEQCESQLAELVPLFARYSGFWKAWGSSAVNQSAGRDDTGLVISLLAAALSSGSFSLAEVLSNGLDTESHIQKEQKSFSLPNASNNIKSCEVAETESLSMPSMLHKRSEEINALPRGPRVDLAEVHMQNSASLKVEGQALEGDESEDGEENGRANV